MTRYLLAVNFQGGVETPMEEVEAGGDYRTSELLQGAAQMTGNPSVTLSRAVAAAMADGPSAGLAVLDRPGHDRLDAVRAGSWTSCP
jgi:predicted RNA polymerase sigma factor